MPTNKPAYARSYYMKNKARILQGMNEVLLCECGSQTYKSQHNRHIKSKRHQTYVKEQECVKRNEEAIAKINGILETLSSKDEEIVLKKLVEKNY
jgi:hypothetical protein